MISYGFFGKAFLFFFETGIALNFENWILVIPSRFVGCCFAGVNCFKSEGISRKKAARLVN
jgi:hypothetical protein